MFAIAFGKGPALVARRAGAMTLGVIIALSCLHDRPVLAQPSADELTLKAAFVSKFPQFVEWPSSVWTRDSFDVCVIAPPTFGAALAGLVSGELLHEQEMRVRHVDGERDIAACAVLFISSSSIKVARELLQTARYRPILTVGDSETFLDEGGMIGLRVLKGRVRFEVNPSAASLAGLQISSQLLKLALNVRRAA
jgi:hypothetical protein